jgi:two-component system, NtrC family, sensor kinase
MTDHAIMLQKYITQNQELEKANRVLKKKLDRLEKDRAQLEVDIEKKEFLLKQVIVELKNSQTALNQQSEALETTLQNLQIAQTHLVQSEKMSALGEMVAGIAHEINNPISFIHGNLNHVNTYTQDLFNLVAAYQQHYPNPPASLQTVLTLVDLDFLVDDLANALRSMEMGSDRIRDIVLSLRNFARLDEAEFKTVDIHVGLENTLMILQHRLNASATQAEIQVIREYGNLPKVECYAGQLNQVFMNLLVNAIDAIADQPTPIITIRTAKQSPNQITIAIADNGCGIPAELQTRIFNPFFTTKEVGKGTGLGLSISHQIITEKHQGKLECSSALGAGSTFMIEIPVYQPSPIPEVG